ncbi:hypothetical protein HDU86_004258 [Geranomyces michiganensis]|nr:hypothetical protein HDU86_004258 [Geranomyces michiganensis]
MYEVFKYPELYIAVEIGSMTLPTTLERVEDTATAEAISTGAAFMERVRKTKRCMRADKPKDNTEVFLD